MIDTWHVVFGEGEDNGARWVRWFTRPGFRHVYAFGYAPAADTWVIVHPTWRRLEVHVAPPDWIDAIIAASRAGTLTVLRVAARAEGRARPRLVVTCAGAIAALVGLRRGALRPRTLFRQLVACGARPVFTAAQEPPRG